MKKHYGNLTVEVMMDFMADHSNYPNSICRHVDKDKPSEFHFETLTSYILVPEERVLYVTYGQPCKYEFIKYML